MNQSIEMQIEACEERLKQAMLRSDIAELDELLTSDLIFTNHLGLLMTKQDDLAAHQSGTLKINEIIFSDRLIKIYGDVAVVSVQTRISGSFAGVESESDFRFTRVWSKTKSDNWQIITGHSCIVA